MLKLIGIAIILYFIYKYLDSKGYDLPLIAWIGIGCILGWIF